MIATRVLTRFFTRLWECPVSFNSVILDATMEFVSGNVSRMEFRPSCRSRRPSLLGFGANRVNCCHLARAIVGTGGKRLVFRFIQSWCRKVFYIYVFPIEISFRSLCLFVIIFEIQIFINYSNIEFILDFFCFTLATILENIKNFRISRWFSFYFIIQ